MAKHKNKDFWYRKYVEAKFDAIANIEVQRGNALKLQAKENKRRLSELNGEAGRLRSMQSTYIPREVFEASVKSVQDKFEVAMNGERQRYDQLVKEVISPMKTWQDSLQGKIIVIVIVGGAVWAAVLALLLKWIK